ncbi:kynureninase [Natronosalvus vescus]|uniref:kynureninase n=1 Tax=Natronosalvus vescus TaxID=2953881 RepID=UPI0020904FE2|nr:kynureninase [Natronosalvus vescus]
MDEFDTTESAAIRRDGNDSLFHVRDRFDLADPCYLDGNSLGPASDAAVATLEHVVEEWRTLGIRGWTEGDPPWFHYGERLGDRLAPMVGANPKEVAVGNSTTVNIHTLIGTFLELADGNRIVVNELDFPTDHYAIRSQLRTRGLDPDDHLVVVESDDGRTIDEGDVLEAIDDETAIVFFPSVLYRSGQRFDLEKLTEAAHDHDAFAGFDLAHSVGAIPHELSAIDADFAVWCHYKYCNAGPGAVAGLYVNERHFGETPGLAGWWGHEKETQFDLETTYTPAHSAGAWQIGTIPIFAAAPLDGALSILEDVGIDAIREGSVARTEYLIALTDERLDEFGVSVGTPRSPDGRGGHVALEHDRAYALGNALRERGYVVDVRPPGVVRVCPSPLYVSYHEVWEFVEAVVDVLEHDRLEAVDREGVT